jgi:hypothetical protein
MSRQLEFGRAVERADMEMRFGRQSELTQVNVDRAEKNSGLF